MHGFTGSWPTELPGRLGVRVRMERKVHCLGLLACKYWKPMSKQPSGHVWCASPASIPPFCSHSPVWLSEGKVRGIHPSLHSVLVAYVGKLQVEEQDLGLCQLAKHIPLMLWVEFIC